MNSATCIGAHDTDPPLPEPGSMLCRRCRQRLLRALNAITELWPLLSVMLTPGNATSGGSHGKPASRPPCSVDVMDITDPRGQTWQQLVSWARVVIEDRQLAPRSLDPDQAARLLTIHADWIAEQPFADEALAEIATVAHRVRRVCRDLPDPPIGHCPDIDPNGINDTCGGPLRWIDGSTAVVCGRCGSQWVDADLPHILRVVEPARRFPVPREWILGRYPVTDTQLRQWLARGHVRAYADKQVELFDVLARITEG